MYLEAVKFAVDSGVGSRGSSMVLDAAGASAHPKLDEAWNFSPENVSFRERVLETTIDAQRHVDSAWVPRRPIPDSDAWFETTWAAFREGRIYD